jgi:hypothetical protein
MASMPGMAFGMFTQNMRLGLSFSIPKADKFSAGRLAPLMTIANTWVTLAAISVPDA